MAQTRIDIGVKQYFKLLDHQVNILATGTFVIIHVACSIRCVNKKPLEVYTFTNKEES